MIASFLMLLVPRPSFLFMHNKSPFLVLRHLEEERERLCLPACLLPFLNWSSNWIVRSKTRNSDVKKGISMQIRWKVIHQNNVVINNIYLYPKEKKNDRPWYCSLRHIAFDLWIWPLTYNPTDGNENLGANCYKFPNSRKVYL